MSNLAKTDQRLPAMPEPESAEQHRLVAMLTSGATVEAGRMTLLPGTEITPAQRSALEARLSTLRSSLEHREPRATKAIIAPFLASYTSMRGNDAEMRLVISTFATILGDIPPWAVAEAARRWARGTYSKAKASPFAPSASQFYDCAFGVIRRYREEAIALAQLLAAGSDDVAPLVRSEAVCSSFDKLRAELASVSEVTP